MEGSCDYRGYVSASEGYRETQRGLEEALDSTVDRIADDIRVRASRFCGRIPASVSGFAEAVASIARQALTVESISGMIMQFAEEQIRNVRIQTVGAVLSMVKATSKPLVTVAVMEVVFGLSTEKEVDLARKLGEGKAMFSKRVVQMRRKFGIESEHKTEVSATYSEDRISQYKRAREKIATIRNP